MTSQSIPIIAKGLSANLRDAVLHSPWTDRVSLCSNSVRTLRALEKRGIIGPLCRFTDLGAQLRDHLQSGEDRAGDDTPDPFADRVEEGKLG